MQAVIKRGFTLVEIMIAFALTIFVIALALYFFSQASSNAEYISKKQHLLNVTSSLLRVIKKDLRSATEAQVSHRGICLKVNMTTVHHLEPACNIFRGNALALPESFCGA